MKYPKSEKYMGNDYMKYIMGPTPLKLCEELLAEQQIPAGARVMDLGSGEGLTSAKSFTRARRCVLKGDFRII